MKRKLEEAVLPLVTKRARGEESDEKSRGEYEATWVRPEANIDPSRDLVFQQLDVDYTMVCCYLTSITLLS